MAQGDIVGYQYPNRNYNYDIQQNIFQKPDFDSYDLKFRIIISTLCSESGQIGSFIRSISKLLTEYDTNKILVILDMSECCVSSAKTMHNKEVPKIKQIIQQLESNSTVAAVFINVYIILPQCSDKYFDFENNTSCVKTIKIEDIGNDRFLGGATKYEIKTNRGRLAANLFNNYCSKTQYISINFDNILFSITYTPILHQLASYQKSYLEQSKDRLFVICIEKIANLHRLHNLFRDYDILDKLLVCVHNNDSEMKDRVRNELGNIQNMAAEYGIDVKNINDTVETIKTSTYKNIVGIDLHPEAYTFKANDRLDILNDSVVIFGFEETGIPQSMLDLCKSYVQFDARASINVVAASSVLVSSLYPSI